MKREREAKVRWRTCPTAELEGADRELRAAARKAAEGAYAVYSGYCVGAAVRLEGGEVVTGSNQENVAYPSGICAERAALWAAGAMHPGEAVEALALVARSGGEEVDRVSPCGGCRQVMIESEARGGRPMRVLLSGREETVELASALDLMPLWAGAAPELEEKT